MPTNINIKNTNQRNQIKVHVENSETVEVEETKGKKTKKTEWKPSSTAYLKPGEQTDVWVAEGRRVTIQEMPT